MTTKKGDDTRMEPFIDPRTLKVREYKNSGEWLREVEQTATKPKEQPHQGEHWETRLRRECGLTI